MQGKITITDNGLVTVSGKVRMSIAEIANLLGIFYQTAKAEVRAVEKSGIAAGDYSAGGTVEGMTVYPDYYGFDMVVAVAFRVQSPQAEIFRRWVLCKCPTNELQPIVLQYYCHSISLREQN